MTKKIGDKKIGSVQSTNEAARVKGAETVGNVEKVKGATAIGGIGSVGGISNRKPTKVMTLAEREQLFQMINEEADKLFKDMPEDKRKIVSEAVKMAVDSGLVEEEE